MKKVAGVVALVAAVWLGWSYLSGRGERSGEGRTVRLATTTSVVDSGLLGALLPMYEQKHGVRVEVASVGSGEAVERLRRGEADVAIVHGFDPKWSGRTTPIWRNDFVLVGPEDAIAVVAGAGDTDEAFRRIAAARRTFVARGDGSGTDRRAKELIARAGVELEAISANAGMGATLERADREDAFTLTDRATLLAKRRSLDLAIVYQDDPALTNEYEVLEGEDASLSSFLVSDEARAIVGGFGIREHAEPLFHLPPRPSPRP